jgi:hypothetical protein
MNVQRKRGSSQDRVITENDWKTLIDRIQPEYTIDEQEHWSPKSKRTFSFLDRNYTLRQALWMCERCKPLAAKHRLFSKCGSEFCVNPEHCDFSAGKGLAWTDYDWERLLLKLKNNSRPTPSPEHLPHGTVEGQCLIWTGRLHPDTKRGLITYKLKTTTSYRWAAMARERRLDVPEDIQTRHLCGCSDCVNPEHLRFGTASENAEDKVIHGTATIGMRNGTSKLTDEQVHKIWNARGTTSQRDISRQYGVSRENIQCILSGQTWTHVTGATKIERKRSERLGLTTEFQLARDYIKTRIRIEEQNQCWIWTGRLNASRYGSASFKGRNYPAHRLSWIAFNEQLLDDNLVVRHGQTCGRNRACCNPEHLTPGTHSDNANDRKRDGTMKVGEDSPLAKMSEEIARAIKNSLGQGTLRERADQFGVDVQVVSSIDHGRTWKHL